MPSLSGSLYSELEPNDTQNGAGLINVHNIPPYDQYSHGGLQVAHQERSPYDENLPQAVPVLIEKQYAPTVAPVFEGSGEKCYPSTALMADQNQPDRETGTGPKRRHLWKWIIIVLLIVVIVVIAVVVGAVVATRKNQNQTISQPSSPTTAPSASPTAAAGASNPSQASPPLLSTFGAFNGTGIAAINPMNNKDALWVFYQDHTAALKYSAFSESGTWGSGMPVGVTNVANATSLTAIAYQPLGLTVYHVFYTDQSGTINDVLYTNVSKSWFAGNISSQGWQLLSGGSGAMSAVFNNVLGKDPSSGGGLRLYAGGEDGQVHEYASDQNTGSWDEGFTFDGTNGYAGTAPEQAGGLTTLHLLNSDNRLELWWRNTNSNTAAYPSGVWNKGKFDIEHRWS
ncbi:hypothetical protein MMC18_007484 [Xylographa bjoerkii]|nr:hypothetical protein [Xylographa bjoerkii]